MSWRTAAGDAMRAKAGDWIATDATGGARSVTGGSFRASFRQVASEVWERVGEVWARPATAGEHLLTQEGPAVAVCGERRVRDEAGAEWFVPEDTGFDVASA